MKTELEPSDYLFVIQGLKDKHKKEIQNLRDVIASMDDDNMREVAKRLDVEKIFFNYLYEQVSNEALIDVAKQLDEMMEKNHNEPNYGYVESVELETYRYDSRTV